MLVVLNTDDGDEIRVRWNAEGSAVELTHDDPATETYGHLRLSGIDLDNLITGLIAMRETRPR